MVGSVGSVGSVGLVGLVGWVELVGLLRQPGSLFVCGVGWFGGAGLGWLAGTGSWDMAAGRPGFQVAASGAAAADWGFLVARAL